MALKWLDAKEPDLSLLNVRDMRGRNVNEELHTPSTRQPTPDPIHVHNTVKYLEKNSIYPTANKSKDSSVS